MSLVPSLLHSILQVDGEALVLHVGEKPYVVTPTGQIELATKGLTFEAVSGIVGQLLSIESQRALDEFGASQYRAARQRRVSRRAFHDRGRQGRGRCLV